VRFVAFKYHATFSIAAIKPESAVTAGSANVIYTGAESLFSPPQLLRLPRQERAVVSYGHLASDTGTVFPTSSNS